MARTRGNSNKIQHRRGTASEWTVTNPILLAGELGYETDTTRLKFGDGGTQWTSLPYVGSYGAADLDGLSDVTLTSPASGSVLRYDGTTWADHVLAKADVGLGNADNTSDASKPVSVAQAAADAAVQAHAIQRANHTGTQPHTTITGLGTLATQSGTFSGTSSGTNTGDQTITLTGDVTGTGTGSFAATLSNSGVSAGTYRSVTVDAKGRVTGGTNPTTLTGYGITDAAPSASPAITGNATFSASSGVPITVTNTGTGNSFVVNDASGDTTPFVIDAGGSVGIGTASPTTRLDVAGADSAISVGTGSYGRYQLSGGNSTGYLYGSFAALADGIHLGYNYYANAAGTGVIPNAAGPTSRVTAGYGFVAFATSSASNTAPTEKVRIDGFGNVGIGTVSPGQRLHVAGSGQGIFIEDTGANRAVLSLTASNTELRIQGTAYTAATQPLTIWTSNLERMRISETGNVGIGTASPGSRLEVIPGGGQGINCLNNGGTGTTNYAVMAQAAGAASYNTGLYANAYNASYNYGVRIINPPEGANNWAIYSDATAQSYFAGNVGIGTASPTISSGVGLHLSGSTIRLGTARTPASSTATGNTGEICWDASYLYICTATNTWRRIAHSTW